jgi:succinoglycan biosynthesis transport protein ExoP
MEERVTGGFELRRVLMIARRRWWIAALCALAVTGAAYAFSKSQQKQYTSSASLLLSDSDADQVLLTVPISQPTVDPTRQADTDISVVSSPAIFDMTAAALHLPATTVASEVTVTEQGQTNVVAIQATDPDPRLAASLANTYAQQAIVFARNTDRAQVQGVQRAVQAQLNRMSAAERASTSGQQLQARNQELQLLADAQTGNAEIINAASVPTSPSLPRTKRNLILGLLFGLLLGIGAALLTERLSRRVRISEELRDIHGLPVLVDVPASRRLRRGGAVLPSAESDREPFRMLLARLRYSNPSNDLRSILLTSAGAKEGKSTIAWHLAAAAAVSSPQRVLLVETDLRKPVLAARYGLRPGPGLADILSTLTWSDDVIQTVTVAGDGNGGGPRKTIDVIVGGTPTTHAATLIESEGMTDLLRYFGESYDLIVLDAAPALLVADAIPLISKVGGVLVVSRVGVTTRDEAAMLKDQLEALNAPTLGLVANGVRGGSGKRYGYYADGSRRHEHTDGHPVDAGASTPLPVFTALPRTIVLPGQRPDDTIPWPPRSDDE